MLSLSRTLKAAPLCCCLFLVAAEGDDCTIRIVGPEPDDCVDREEFCPDLQCDEFRTNDDGCEICECADPVPPQECLDDADCAPGLICELRENCPPCVNADPACEAACVLSGVCVEPGPGTCDDGTPAVCDMLPPSCPAGSILAQQNGCFACVDPNTCRPIEDPCALVDCGPGSFCDSSSGQAQCVPFGCFSDFDCGPSEICSFDETCGARPDGIVACTGQCVPALSCANVLCAPGTTCQETGNGPQCVPDDTQCVDNADCGPGAHCETFCAADPSCPNCDVCRMVGVCVDDGCPALCGPGSECVVNPDGTVGCVPVQTVCLSDGECGEGERCNADELCLPPPGCSDPSNGGISCPDVCAGFCVPATCTDDTQCRADETCVIDAVCPPCAGGDPACLVPCFAEGHCQPRP